MIIPLFLLYILFAGQKNEVVSSNPIHKNLRYLIDDSLIALDGQFNITESRSLATRESVANSMSFSAAYMDVSTRHTEDLPVIIQVNSTTIPNSSGFYHTAFDSAASQSISGNTILITSASTDTNSYAHFHKRFYVPKAIHMSFPDYTAIGFDLSGNAENATNINSDDAITWNSDVSNAFGVIITVEYIPNYLGNDSLQLIGNSISQRNLITVPDNGSATLNCELTKDIPDHSIIKLTISRGNAVVFPAPKNSSKKLKITASTTEDGLFRFNKHKKN